MNKLSVGEQILKLRKNKNITQEELADKIGISAGAVSKWENGNSMPDITLLAPLARALDTSIDELLSFRQDLSKDEVNKIRDDLTRTFMTKGYDDGEKECRKYLKEYPNNINLKLAAAEILNMNILMCKEKSEEMKKDTYIKLLKIFNEIADSNNAECSPTALFHIASIHLKLENYDESEKALKRLPKVIDSVTIYPTVLMNQNKYDEASKLCSNKLLYYVNNAYLMLFMMSKISMKQGKMDEALFYLDTCYKVQNIFKLRSDMTAYKYAELNLKAGDKEKAAEWVKIYVDQLLSIDYDYKNNPFFNTVVLEFKPEVQKIFLKKALEEFIENDEFNELKGIKAYEEAMEKLKRVVE